MRIFFDTEFVDDGHTIQLISIGLVREDGKEYYAEPEETSRITTNVAVLGPSGEWILQNVIPHLTGPVKPRAKIAEEIAEFCGPRTPEFWAYYASYDWVCLCQLYGRMLDVPAHWPNFVNDIQSLRYLKRVRWQPDQLETRHHALADARWNKQFFEFLTTNV